MRDNAGFRLPAALPTLATLLHDRGFRTGAFVSAFPLDGRFGLSRGFDEYDDRFVGSAPRPALLEQERPGTETVAHAMAWLQARRDTPAFCWVHLYEPHFPYAPPEPFATHFRGAPYDGEVAATDAALAPLLDPLLSAGRASDTLVVLTSDHGESLGEHGEATHGIFAYEATLRVPLILYAPGSLAPRVVDAPVRHVDILPTILDALGVPTPPGLRGRSLISLARGAARPDEDSYFEALSGMLNRGWAPLTGVPRGRSKFIELPIAELYDLAADPVEQRNLADADPQRRDALRAVLAPFAAAAPVTRTVTETADARDRLRSLGYVTGSAPARRAYAREDDPKQQIASDAALQAIVGRYLDGDTAGALEEARRFARAHPTNAVALLHLGQLERESGRLPDAIAAMRKAMALAPANVTAAALLGTYLTEDGHPEEAIALLTPLASGPGRDVDVDILSALGLAQARRGAFDAALSTLARARAEAPRNSMLLVHAGTVEMMAGRTADARRSFEAAIAESPTLARAHSSLGALEIDAGRTDAAVAQFRSAVASNPSEFGRLFILGVTLARRGEDAKARPYLAFVAESAPAERYGPQIAQARGWLAAHRQ